MSEWASKLMNAVLPTDRPKGDFDQYLTEVSNDQAERMYFQKEIDIEYECRPTYEQLSIDRIIDEANRNMNALKVLENLISERLAGFSAFSGNITKYRAFAECFENNEGSLRISIDSFCLFIDQEIQQAKQQIFLGDLKRSLTEMRGDAQRRIQEYQKEIAAADQELATAEKKITKLKEKQEKSMSKGDTFADLDLFINKGSRKSSSFSSKDKELKNREVEDSVLRYEKEMSEEIRALLRCISNRDQVLSASRKAFQKLDRECKRAIYYTLRKILDKERENFEIHKLAMEKLDRALQRVDIEQDINIFIQSYRYEEGALVLNSHALSLLSDLIPHHRNSGSRPSSRQPSPSSSFSSPPGAALNPPTNNNNRASVKFSGAAVTSSNPSIPASTEKVEKKRKSFRSSIMGRSKHDHSPTRSSSPPPVTPTAPPPPPPSISSLIDEEYNRHLTNIFYAVDEKKNNKVESNSPPPSTHGSSNNNNSTSNTGNGNHQQQKNRPVDSSHLIDELAGQNPSFEESEERFHTPHSSPPPTIDPPESPPPSSSPLPPPISLAPSASLNESSPHSDHPPPVPSNDPPNEPRKVRTHDEADKDPYTQKFVINKRFSMNATEVKTLTPTEIAEIRARPELQHSVEWLCNNVRSNRGREAFTAELNKFRSTKVNLETGFNALVIVLWTALTYCQRQNDVKSAKTIMMLSQTFYRVRPETQPLPGAVHELIKDRLSRGSSRQEDDEEDDEETIAKRGVLYRQYIKEKILGHPLWEDGNYWEQALWQCAIEQLQTIPYEMPWYDMDRENRDIAVRRVHDVVFSQVMAITHSMMELGCSQQQTREFLYRMCVVHQLTEAQRQQLLQHILRQRNDSNSRSY